MSLARRLNQLRGLCLLESAPATATIQCSSSEVEQHPLHARFARRAVLTPSHHPLKPPGLADRPFCTQTFAQTPLEAEDDVDQGEEGDGEEQLRTLLLDTALDYVKDKGWSTDALRAAAQYLGLSPAFAGVLPRGELDLVTHFSRKCNRELEAKLQLLGPDFTNQGTTAKVKQAVRMRLEMLIPYVDTWPQALWVLSSPNNAAHTLQLAREVVDTIWAAAGDTSTDLSWYSKRIMLAGVYSATELYMLTDCSPGFADTWDVLDRRMADALALGGWARNIQAMMQRQSAA